MALAMNPNLKWVFRPDGAFVYDACSGLVKVLNETGAFIVQRCDKSASEIADAIVDAFDVPSREAALADVKVFLQQMVEGGYLCEKQ